MGRLILLTGARAPCALHLARTLATAGHVVVLADSLAFPLARATRYAVAYARLPSPRAGLAAYGAAVRAACDQYGLDLVIPTCEEVFFLAAGSDRLGADLLAPPFDLLRQVHNKFTFIERAAGLGADAAETRLIDGVFEDDPRDWVFKPVWSRFGDRALIRPANVDSLRPTAADPWIAQRYLPGEELVEKGKPVGGMFIVAAGRVQIVDGADVKDELGSGEFLFASQVLAGGAAPHSARAGRGGTLVLFAGRGVAHELLVSVPPLLEIFAG